MAKKKKTGVARTVKRTKKVKASELVRLDAQIAAGEYRIEEVELLKLQKLHHQSNALAREFNDLQKQANEKRKKANIVFTEYQALQVKIRKEHGLEDWHDIVVEHDDPSVEGKVVLNKESKQKIFQARAANEKEEAKESEPAIES